MGLTSLSSTISPLTSKPLLAYRRGIAEFAPFLSSVRPVRSEYRPFPNLSPTNTVKAIATLISSVAFGKIGRYSPFLFVGAAISAVGGGLIYTLDVDTGLGKQIGYQILLGAGVGVVVQIAPIIAGAVSSDEDKAIALGAVLGKLLPRSIYELRLVLLLEKKAMTNCDASRNLVTQFYSAALVIAASSAITNNLLIQSVPKYAPSVSVADVLAVGPYDLERYFTGDDLRGIRQAYVYGLRGAWALGIALWGISFFTVFLAKWPGQITLVNGGKDKSAAESDSGEGEKNSMPMVV